MILVETSAWIEFLRGTSSTAARRVGDLLRAGELATTDPVMMELLAGARSAAHERQLESLLGRARSIRCLPEDFVAAARLYRTCRLGGETVRQLVDCLVAAIAIRESVPVLHADRDFEILARHSVLLLAT